ncbi:leucyl aminopeptidase [Mycena galericulata]|nr:leucyl aminopeptidase [Mycena galericulata]
MSSQVPASQDKYRLPTNFKPKHYDVTIWTDLKSLEFGGVVTVDLDVLEGASEIVFNCSDDLKLGEASILCDALETDQFQSAQIVEKKEGRASLKSLAALPAGSKAQLKVHFDGKLRGSMTGYYKSTWQKDGQADHYALTQFQPIDARAAFPCWDEPSLKATFSITMVSRSDTVNISNMPVVSEDVHDPNSASLFSALSKDVQWKVTKFQKTPPMSTYLVAFANGPFAYQEKIIVMPLSGRTIPLRVYATPDIIDQAEFCLDVTAKVMPLYETIFDIEYPLPKLDTLAAHDFDLGAMENWGLITGRIGASLLDSTKADITARKQVARAQTHEVGHMWFGNITTMKWWDNLYLNEGFASLMGEVIVLGAVFPEWDGNAYFVARHWNNALTLDAKRSSHPIEVECPDPNFINQIFDALSYSKAASVLRMLSNYVGEEKFLKGVSLYLKAHLYSNTVTRDLWDGISAATGLDVQKFMDNWVSKIGFPLITVSETAEGIHVRQNRFLVSGEPTADEDTTIWTVPLEILTVEKDGQVHINKTAVLDEREKTFALDTSRTFKINAGTIGTYRVLYTPERLSKIAAEAAKENSVFALQDRIGLIYDVAALSAAGLAQLSSLFTLIDIWRNESNYMVWTSAWTSISTVVRTFWEHPHITQGLEAFLRSLFVPMVQRLGYEFPKGESVDIVQLRKLAIDGAFNGRDQSVIKELKDRFDHYMETGEFTRIPANIQGVIFKNAVQAGGQSELDALLKMIENPPNAGASDAAIAAVGMTQDSDHINDVLNYILTKSRDQEAVFYCRGLQANPLARRRVANFLMNEDNYAAFSKRFATNSMMKYLLQSCLNGLSTEDDYNKVQTFFEGKDTSRYSMVLAQVLEGIRGRTTSFERSSDDLSKWLTEWEQRSTQ